MIIQDKLMVYGNIQGGQSIGDLIAEIIFDKDPDHYFSVPRGRA